MNSLALPLAFAVDDRRRSTVLIAPNLYARLDDERLRLGWSFTRFAEWCLEQFLDLLPWLRIEWRGPGLPSVELLDVENRELVEDIVGQLGEPWTRNAVLNRLLSEVREQVRAGKLRPSFWLGQLRTVARG